MQDRLTYANGNTITTEGFRCSVGEPIDIKVTVGDDEEVYLFYINSGDYLVTLEVNGEKAAYRDLHHLGEDEVTIGNYTLSDDMYLTGVSEDDEVVMRLEPVELTVTDAFRAAVSKTAPKSGGGSGGGGTGGGVLEVTVDWDTADGTLDKTWQEIADAPMAIFKENGYTYFCVLAKQMGAQYGVVFASVNTASMAWENRHLFVASSADGYPVVLNE